ncbi:hypothetical protein ACFCYH_06970 [Streptomyces sp. NPDC056400]|uniref:hypothetical protein n=1 Tax=Streptomyces sp. NPDC056400 TaxID=3345808 RepID=UPI0035D7C440
MRSGPTGARGRRFRSSGLCAAIGLLGDPRRPAGIASPTDRTRACKAARDEQLRTGTIDAVGRSWPSTPYFDATGTELPAGSGVTHEPLSQRGGQKLQL